VALIPARAHMCAMTRFAKIDEPALATMVRAFYGRARLDPVLAPIFEAAVEDWEAHFDTLTRFWASVMLGVRSYDGRPMPAHMRHPIEPHMFDRWLAIWAETASDLFEPAPAALLIDKSRTIARGLSLGLFFRPEPAAG
jgi:hemoglobin